MTGNKLTQQEEENRRIVENMAAVLRRMFPRYIDCYTDPDERKAFITGASILTDVHVTCSSDGTYSAEIRQRGKVGTSEGEPTVRKAVNAAQKTIDDQKDA